MKGDSRMIGMSAFGGASWNVEQVLTLWLTEAKSGTSDLYALLDHTVVFLGAWIEEVRIDGVSTRTAQILSEYVQQVDDGKTFLSVESAIDSTCATEVISQFVKVSLLSTKTEEVAMSDDQITLVGNEVCSVLPELLTFAHNRDHLTNTGYGEYHEHDVKVALVVMYPQIGTFEASAEIISFPGSPAIRPDDSIKEIGDLSTSLPIYNIYLSETDQLVRL
ncbi:MAG: hypothetical protein H7240_13335 [Glaciimonas sp.]|nr:hypothetical protein [Glaciimonas sp.]